MSIGKILKEALERKVSDIILSPLSKPSIKLNGKVILLEEFEVFNREGLNKIVLMFMSDKQKKEFEEKKELDFSINLKGYSRFRVNAFMQRDGYGTVLRVLNSDLPKFEDLGVPKHVLDFVTKKTGLILVTGSVGSGKSTTLAALLNHINLTQNKHIITIEDPVEYVFKNDKSVIEQREVGEDTHTFGEGLQHALRQASDVIMVGEMRNLETFRLALRAAETGNLVLATLHTAGAARTISRIIDMFSGDEKDQVRGQLSQSLIGVVWQDLIEKSEGGGRVAVCEVLVNSPNVANMIRKENTHQINGAIETGRSEGMISMKESLRDLSERGIISEDTYDFNMKFLNNL